MIEARPFVAGIARLVRPSTWRAVWRNLEGKTAADARTYAVAYGDRQLARLYYVHDRGFHRALWWSTPLGYALILFWTYKAYQVLWICRRQTMAAQLVAVAYGQGGQWLSPVPR